jgi:hypothetical protein
MNNTITTGYEQYGISELLEMYNESKYMSFMCLYTMDKGNWRKWCKICAEINLTIHVKEQLQ